MQQLQPMRTMPLSPQQSSTQPPSQQQHQPQLADVAGNAGQQDWVDQVNQDPVIADLRKWLHEAARQPAPDESGRPRLPPPLNVYSLPNGDQISCVFWGGRHYITGTDIVKILLFRFHHIGRQVLNTKKFEEGVFSDLRNLKPGVDAVLEEPKSPFLEFLYKNNCIRTQKKQKVFFWYKVPHDALFRDAMERDLKREASLYQTVHLFNVNQRMMRAGPAMGMMPMQLASPQGLNGLASIAPQPYMDPQAAAYYYASLASPQQMMLQQQHQQAQAQQAQMIINQHQQHQHQKRASLSGTVDPSMLYDSQSPLLQSVSHASLLSPQPNTRSSNPSLSASSDPLMMLDDSSAKLLSDFADPMPDGPDFNVDQFVDFTTASNSRDTGSPREGLTL